MSPPSEIDDPVTVQRTDTGQFLLRHPSGATALGETLDETWAALALTLAQDAQPPAPEPAAARGSRRLAWGLPLAGLLAFAWIGALYLALGSIRAEVAGVAPGIPAQDALTARVGALEAEVSRLGAALDAALRMAPPPPDVETVVPLPKPAPEAAAPATPQPPSPAPPGLAPAPRPSPAR